MRTEFWGVKKSWVQTQKQSLEKALEWGTSPHLKHCSHQPQEPGVCLPYAWKTSPPKGPPAREPPGLRTLPPHHSHLARRHFCGVCSECLRHALQSRELPWWCALMLKAGEGATMRGWLSSWAPSSRSQTKLPQERGRGGLRLCVRTRLTMLRFSFTEAKLVASRAQSRSAGEAPSDIHCICC